MADTKATVRTTIQIEEVVVSSRACFSCPLLCPFVAISSAPNVVWYQLLAVFFWLSWHALSGWHFICCASQIRITSDVHGVETMHWTGNRQFLRLYGLLQRFPGRLRCAYNKPGQSPATPATSSAQGHCHRCLGLLYGVWLVWTIGATSKRIWPLMFQYLLGGLEHGFYFSIYWEFHHPNWLSYFSEGLKPPTSVSIYFSMWRKWLLRLKIVRVRELGILFHQHGKRLCPKGSAGGKRRKRDHFW